MHLLIRSSKCFIELICQEAVLCSNLYIIQSIIMGRLILQLLKWKLIFCYMFSGVCVCNESNLTGEPMPVSKIKAPDNSTLYDSEGARGARHTLFSGTEVLQAGARDTGEVLAIVTATGELFIPWRNQPHFPPFRNVVRLLDRQVPGSGKSDVLLKLLLRNLLRIVRQCFIWFRSTNQLFLTCKCWSSKH